MKMVFADTLYWVAIARPGDPWGEAARRTRASLQNARILTTDEVLVEFLTAMRLGGATLRSKAVSMVRAILNDPNVTVLPQTRRSFLDGVDLYSRRADKEYSLTDCISMNAMNAKSVSEILTNDNHFAQEGFTVLITHQ
jgi:predicted nucleic acid-binding protein